MLRYLWSQIIEPRAGLETQESTKLKKSGPAGLLKRIEALLWKSSCSYRKWLIDLRWHPRQGKFFQ